MYYDIIGDVHGEYDKLVELLKKLGYSEVRGSWRQSGHTAIFVGDLIDRGPQQVQTVNLVRRMVDAGSGQCIMGNHEFNAIAWLTEDPGNSGKYLREDNKKNREQHKEFLNEVENKPIHRELVNWFKTLPLWLDHGSFRVIHACWNEGLIGTLTADADFTKDNTITGDLWIRANSKGHAAYDAVEALCKGLEVQLPDGHWFTDRKGIRRDMMRFRWWDRQFTTYRKAALVPEHVLKWIPEIDMIKDDRILPYEGKPVFFGHYGLSGAPALLGQNLACVDYSAEPEKQLTAYRWDGDARLKAENLVFV